MFGPEKSSFAHGGRGAGGTSSVEVNTNTTDTTNTYLCLQTPSWSGGVVECPDSE